MKILKYFIFLILVILIGGTVFFATQNGSFNIAETKIIQAHPEVVFNQIKDFKNWETWGPWSDYDENIKIIYAEKTEGIGSSYSWESDILGNGSIETVKVIPNQLIDQKIKFQSKGGESESDFYWRFEETDTTGQTKVIWGMKGEFTLMEKVIRAFKKEDKTTGLAGMFQKGLEKLEEIVQSELAKYSIRVDGVSEYQGGYYMYHTIATKQSEIANKMSGMFGDVVKFMTENNIQSSGMPFTIYNEIDMINGTVIFSTCIPVNARVIVATESSILCGYMANITAIKTTLKGNYTNIPEAYVKANGYLNKHQLIIDSSKNMFEIYANDPEETPNPANWTTEIYIPIVKDSKSEQAQLLGY